MNSVTVLGLSRLEGCQGNALADKLMTEDCNWVCKHKRPVMRCNIHFDPVDYYGMSNDLEACWIRENCTDTLNSTKATTNLVATCQPEAGALGVLIELSGTFTLVADDASAILQSPNAESALKEGLASSLDGVSSGMIEIKEFAAVRRLAASPSRFLSSQSLITQYTITAPEADAGTISNSLSTANTTAMASQMRVAFESVGISTGAVTVSNVSQPTSIVKDSDELRRSRSEMAILKSVVAIVDQHLAETIEELNATLQTLHNSSNLTQEQRASLETVHAEAKARLENLIESSRQIHEQLRNTSVWHNSTIAQLAEAQAAASIANSRYQQTLSDLTASQAALSAAHAKSNATRDQLYDALSANNLTLAQLANLNSTHSAVAEQLESLNSNYTNALQEFSQILNLRNSVQDTLQQVEQTRDATLTVLTDAQTANQNSLDGLQAVVDQEKSLDANLTQVTASLSSVREELFKLADDYNTASAALKNTRMSLADAIAELAEAQKRWDEEKAAAQAELEKERDAHDNTKQALQQSLANEESANNTTTILFIIAGTSLFLVGIFAFSFCMIFRFRKRLSLWCLRCHICHTDSTTADAENVVVGRPVGANAGSAPPGKNAECNGETAKGTPAPSSSRNDEFADIGALSYVPPSLAPRASAGGLQASSSSEGQTVTTPPGNQPTTPTVADL